MTIRKLLVANRGEIACRIIRTCDELGISTVGVHSSDDLGCQHLHIAGETFDLGQAGAAAYLDVPGLVEAAKVTGCDSVHPGYGFASESAELAEACAAAGLTFVGQNAEVLSVYGDKTRARELAVAVGVPVLDGSGIVADLAEGLSYFRGLPTGSSVMIKAANGGGGRGISAVTTEAEFADALERCAAIAMSTSGSADVFVERKIDRARHIEVQVLGDEQGNVGHLWDRDCSLQRQHAKVIEQAPAPHLAPELAAGLRNSALALMAEAGGAGLVTFEFLVDEETDEFFFLEANPRLQVEHTVTEEITGLDLVAIQIALASGVSLEDLDLIEPPPIRGQAMELRINAELMRANGDSTPQVGTISRFETPGGRGIRVDSHLYGGYEVPAAFDSLLAKLIVHTESPDGNALWAKAHRALARMTLEGVGNNIEFLSELVGRVANSDGGPPNTSTLVSLAPEIVPGLSEQEPVRLEAGPGVVASDLVGTVVKVMVVPGSEVAVGQPIVVIEAMKMEHVITAEVAGVVAEVSVAEGDTVATGASLLRIEEGEVSVTYSDQVGTTDPNFIRPDLAEVIERHEIGLDHRRADQIAKRYARGRRSARENVADLVDEGSFVEVGPLVVAAQRRRKPMSELIERTPGDGLVGGIGSVNGESHPDTSQTVVVTYDYTVMAGTQGYQNHRKKDRLFEQAARLRLPVIMMAEGGGGRPGDSDPVVVASLDCLAFQLFAELSGLVPLVGVNTGYCFAGNAALLGCCDVIIATVDSNVGMGGPAMISGGGLGDFHPSEVGPADVQAANGVIDIVVADDAEAMAVAKKYLSYFQGSLSEWEVADQRELRHLIPENRLRIYDVRQVLEGLFDTDSVLELRQGYAEGMITALARVEGRPVGVLANNPSFNAGAIDAEGSDKASRFMQLCDAFDLPIVNLCDTPGFMVGPPVEAEALVRRASRMFVVGANVDVPMVTVILRKGYGLGAQAMAGGSFKAPIFTIAWPTSEFGAMGLEGAVKLGFRAELAAISDEAEREATYQKMVDRMYEIGKGTSMADHFEIDDVIDPADTRRWIVSALESSGPPPRRAHKKRRNVDTW